MMQYAAAFILSFFFALCLTPLMRKAALQIGIVDSPDGKLKTQGDAVPYLWHWRDLRPQAMRAAELVGTQQAERRVLRLTNPKLPGVAIGRFVRP